MSPTAKEMKQREGVVKNVTRFGILMFGNDAEVLPFGSQVTGLCLLGLEVVLSYACPKKRREVME